jgi:hypothetical protein
MTILMHSCRSGSLEMVQWVIEHGFGDPHYRDEVVSAFFRTTVCYYVSSSGVVFCRRDGLL